MIGREGVRRMSSGTYTVSEGKGAEPIDAGVYPAKFVGWEEKDEGQYGPYLRLEFEIVDGDYEGIKRSIVASTKLTKGKKSKHTSKLFTIVTTLMGREPKAGEDISLKDLVGSECQIVAEAPPEDEDGWQEIRILPSKK